jgi:predicted Zn finger-like uncharacterized protein
MFKVVPDQLKVSEGWVRCGHCSEVFDAQAHLQAALTPEPLAMDVPVPPTPAVQVEARFASYQQDWPAEPAPHAVHGFPGESIGEQAFDAWSSAPAVVEEPPPASPPEQVTPDALVVDEIPLADTFEAAEGYVIEEAPRMDLPIEARANPLDDAFAAPLPSTASEEPAGSSELAAGPPDADVPPEPEFVRQARRQALWARPAARAILALLALVLLLLLGVQVVVQERDQIAAQLPQTRGALQAMCATLGCKVSALRQIDAIQIDSSTFNKLRGDSFRLAFVVRNSAAVALATPAMELTLTDTQDQPVLRRVLLPSELAGAPPVLAAGAEWPASLTLAVDAGLPRVSGYRLMAFYP